MSKRFITYNRAKSFEVNADKSSVAGLKYIDSEDMYVLPEIIDIHTHGSMGACANDLEEEAFAKMSKYMVENGVSGYLSTVITDSAENLLNICNNYSELTNAEDDVSLGIYMEGPFLNPQKKGAHNEKYLIEPDINFFMQLYKASDEKIKVVTVAPELKGAIGFIREVSKYCRVAIGHSAADYETAIKAFDAGATSVTHIFNAMNPMMHRAPGIIGAARDAQVYIELISDGVHIHPAVVRMVFEMFRKDRIILISDSISATGLPDGKYTLGGLNTAVKDGESRLEDGTLAGSTTNLFLCLKKALEFGIDIQDVIRAVSSNPKMFLNGA